MKDYFNATTPSPITDPSSGMINLRPDQIRLGQRKHTKPGQNQLIRLAGSIKKYGILEPLSVRPVADRLGLACFELVDGYRRLAAASLAGLEKIPCIVLSSDDDICAKTAGINRICSESRHFLDTATAFRALMDAHHMTQEDLAHCMGLSQSAVANKLRLLRLSTHEQEKIKAAGLTERHARALLRIKDSSAREKILMLIVKEAANVSTTEAAVEAYLCAKKVEKGRELPEAIKGTSNTLPDKSLRLTPSYTQESEERREEAVSAAKGGINPSKFALRDLRPLYNSIDRALSIFRKTGSVAECTRQEEEDCVRILISIPRQAR